MAVPPTILRGRMRTVTYVYDDPDHPDRPTGHVQAPEWTDADRCLLLGLARYEDTLCPGCGERKDLAWHDQMDGEYEVLERWVCHSCTARDGKQAVFTIVGHSVAPERIAGFPPFEIGVSTTEPAEHPDE